MAHETVIGVDIGATKTAVVYAHRDHTESIAVLPTPQNPNDTVDEICSAVERHPSEAAPTAVGIGCPGPLDHDQGIVLSPPNLPQWHGFPLCDELSKRLSLPVRLDNDGNLGALGEATHGAGKGRNVVFYLAVGTGLGAGMTKDGHIVRGATGCAAEVWAFAPSLFSGSTGPPVNDIASGRGLVLETHRAIAEGFSCSLHGEIDTQSVVVAYQRGDVAATEAFRRSRDALTAVIVFAVMLIDPDVVVLGGGMCDDPSWYIDPVRRLYAERMPVRQLRGTPVRGTMLKREAVIMGAISLARGL